MTVRIEKQGKVVVRAILTHLGWQPKAVERAPPVPPSAATLARSRQIQAAFTKRPIAHTRTLGQQPMTSQIRREPARRKADSRRAKTMSVQRADELSYPFGSDADFQA
jgi:hypothetical protein